MTATPIDAQLRQIGVIAPQPQKPPRPQPIVGGWGPATPGQEPPF